MVCACHAQLCCPAKSTVPAIIHATAINKRAASQYRAYTKEWCSFKSE
jgi:hypothetical protein